jgi:hypothetical protein
MRGMGAGAEKGKVYFSRNKERRGKWEEAEKGKFGEQEHRKEMLWAGQRKQKGTWSKQGTEKHMCRSKEGQVKIGAGSEKGEVYEQRGKIHLGNVRAGTCHETMAWVRKKNCKLEYFSCNKLWRPFYSRHKLVYVTPSLGNKHWYCANQRIAQIFSAKNFEVINFVVVITFIAVGTSFEGNTKEENNGYVVFKWNIHGSAGKQSQNL